MQGPLAHIRHAHDSRSYDLSPLRRAMHATAWQVHIVATFLFGLHAYWNSAFFMYRTVDAHTRYVLKKKEAKEAGKAL